MAYLQPSDITPLALADARASEIETLKYLQTNLPNDYTIFHSVHWASESATRSAFGEIDFVIVNRAGEILVIEQKDGVLEETTDGLVKRYGNKSKTVSSQVQRNIGSTRKKFSKQFGSESGLIIDYLVYCPHYRVLDFNGAGIDASRTIDAASKNDLAKRVQQLLSGGDHDKEHWGHVVRSFFANTMRIVPDISSYVSSQDRVYTQTLEGLRDVIDKLDFSPFRLRVVGTAGCGKSQLTLRFCDQALAKGGRPLLLCFNNPLAVRLRSAAHSAITVSTYHDFCAKFAESQGVDLDLSQSDQPGFWRGLQDLIVAAEIPDDAKFDYLVVDEGQDFKQDWYDILQLFLNEDASVLWLEDPLQNLTMKPSVEMKGFVAYKESANFRTPRLISEFIKDVLNTEFDNKNPLPGLGVEVHTYENDNEQKRIVTHRVSELVREGFSHEQIVVISCKGLKSNSFKDCDQIGTLKLRKFSGKYDKSRKQIYSDGDVYFDTIFRFKGQQAPAIIVIDIDDSLKNDDRAKNILYCAMTRATVHLELLVSNGSYWAGIFQKAL